MNQAKSSVAERVRLWLQQQGPATASAIGAGLQISQSTVSRALTQLGRCVVRIGRARSAQYALLRALDDVPAEIPIYRIDDSGQVHPAGTLSSLAPDGFFCTGLTSQPLRTPDLPYFLEDARPIGFLGRRIPTEYPTLHVPSDIRLWNAAHSLRYLTHYGWNLPGDLMFGDDALRLYHHCQTHPPPTVDAATATATYETMAAEMHTAHTFGSSVAGEQPKFLAWRGDDHTPVLVKFSPPRVDATSERIADLLICEHVAHVVLRAHGKSAALSHLHIGPTRTFLEVERFDRVGRYGRRGVLSLTTVDLGCDGILRSWHESAASLHRHGVITDALRDEIYWREYFGMCIANTDMHGGNCAFFTTLLQPTAVAPTYDMLPMAYFPPRTPAAPTALLPPPYAMSSANLRAVHHAARDFWERVRTHPHITENFRAIAAQHRTLFSE